MKNAAIIALSVSGTLALSGMGFGLYALGVNQSLAINQYHNGVTPPVAPRLEQPAVPYSESVPAPALVVATSAPVVVATSASVATASPSVTSLSVSAPTIAMEPTFARVIKVDPVTVSWQEPRNVCQQVIVQRSVEGPDSTRVAGTVLGAAAGGLLGNQVGGGSGKKVATVIGALAGAQLGNQARSVPRTYNATEQQCHTVMESRSRTTGYQVTYQLGQQQGVVHMDKRPGDYLPVDNGRVVVF
ncbi:MAG: hypothetical protein CVV10_00310 [Gammaproteobacteria bacterium HGW-Gammaproteobacteria-14]|nr:MAG: hypothetical protein CVV10_00310 [Gammaproteobacteria bacterium HGW-Gammaproteobacteria-14]